MAHEVRTAFVVGIFGIVTAAISAAAAIYVGKQDIKEVRSSLRRYIYDNGAISSTSLPGGKMIVRINGSRNAGPVFAKIDMQRLIAMCSDDDGCTLTLGATRFRSKLTGYILDVPLQGAACRFFYSPSKHWSFSQACVATYGLYKYSNDKKQWEYNRPYQVYEYSNSYGVDDSYRDSGDPDGQPLIVLSFKGACYLAESAPDVKKGGGYFLPDDPRDENLGAGLFLVASSPSWDHPGAYPPDIEGNDVIWPADDPLRQCILIVDD